MAKKRATPSCRSALGEAELSTKGDTFRHKGALITVLLLPQMASTRAGSTGRCVKCSLTMKRRIVVNVGDTETSSELGRGAVLSAPSYAGLVYICNGSAVHSGSRSGCRKTVRLRDNLRIK